MGKLISIHLKVSKPKLCMNAMCVYKFTLDTGFYYYGATTDLGERISSHLKMYRNAKHSKWIMDAMKNATAIKFEFVRFVNDRKDLSKWEEYYLTKNVGLPKCLNIQEYITTTYTRSEALHKVVKVDKGNNILKVYLSPAQAAKENGISVSTILSNCNAKFPVSKTFFRRINESGEIINPINPMRKNPSSCKVIRQYDKDMNFIKEFTSLSEAARWLGIDRKNISDVTKGKALKSFGFVFRQLDDNGAVIEPLFIGQKKRYNKVTNALNATPNKPIHKMDLNGDIIETYRSLYMAIKNVHVERRTLTTVIKRNKPLNGFLYKYA